MSADSETTVAVTGYWQLIEGHRGDFSFTLRAGNHEPILQGGVWWSRQAALEAIERVRALAQLPEQFAVLQQPDGQFRYQLCDPLGRVLGTSLGCRTRGGALAGVASVRRNAASTRFRGLVRRSLDGS